MKRNGMKRKLIAVFCLTLLILIFACIPVLAASVWIPDYSEPYGNWPYISQYTNSAGEPSATVLSALSTVILSAAASLISVVPITAAAATSGSAAASGTAAGFAVSASASGLEAAGLEAAGLENAGTQTTDTSSSSSELTSPSGTKKYKLYMNKSFGRTIQFGSPVQISVRLSEVTPDGLELDRIDLTKKLEIFAGNKYIKIGSAAMSENYMNITVVAIPGSEGEKAEEGIVCFKLSGIKQSFRSNVKFILEEAAL